MLLLYVLLGKKDILISHSSVIILALETSKCFSKEKSNGKIFFLKKPLQSFCSRTNK